MSVDPKNSDSAKGSNPEVPSKAPAEIVDFETAEPEYEIQFDEENFDHDFDDDFEEEVKGEYDLEDDLYGAEFSQEFGHLDVDNDNEK